MRDSLARSRQDAGEQLSASTDPAHESLLRRTIVVLDDDPGIGEFLESALSSFGMNAICIDNAVDFCAAVVAQRPSLILLDLALGHTDAVTMLTLLQTQRYEGPVVLMSGHYPAALDHTKRIGTRLGLNIAAVLSKPFDLVELQDKIVSALTAGQPSRRQANTPMPWVSLHDAIEDRQVEFWFQPKVDLLKDERAGIEILARVRHPELGVLSPASFLDGASPASLRWLAMAGLRHSLHATKTARAQGRPIGISINIAHSTLDSRGFLEELKSIREQIDPTAEVTLEITETDLGASDAADLFCTRAVLHGFKISIDDFGHGYATFERLRTMPFAELKIERSLVHGCAQDTRAQRLCGAAVRLAHDFNASAVAEGVERAEDLAIVRALGFDLVQGYHFAKPAPLSALANAR